MLRYHPNGEVAVTGSRNGTLEVRVAETLDSLGEPMIGHTAEIGIFEKAMYFFGDH